MPVINAVFSDLLTQLRSSIEAEWAWPSPDAAFSVVVAKSLPSVFTASPFNSGKSATWLTNTQLHQAPALASCGYVLNLRPGDVTQQQKSDWLAGLDRISGKKTFADREFFGYRPFEVLGIALGIKAIPEASAKASWLSGIIAQVHRERDDDFWTQLLGAFSGWLIGHRVDPKVAVSPSTNPLDELALVRWLGVAFPHFAKERGIGRDTQDFDQQLLERVIKEPVPALDLPKASVLRSVVELLVRQHVQSVVGETWQVDREEKDAIHLVTMLCRRFHLFATQIVHRHGQRSTITFADEYDVQDAMYAILKLHFDDVRAEEVAPSLAGKSTRIDFLLKQEQIVIEIKMMRKGLDQNKVANELIEDKERYRTHPDAKTLICLVYDPAQACQTPKALEKDLSTQDADRQCIVIVVPSGV